MFHPPRRAHLIKPISENAFSRQPGAPPSAVKHRRYRNPLTTKKSLREQSDYQKMIRKLGNNELFQQFQDDTQADDYDGGFTLIGAWRSTAVTRELVRRLKKSGFLKG